MDDTPLNWEVMDDAMTHLMQRLPMQNGGTRSMIDPEVTTGRGLHSSTSQLNLSRV